MCDYLALKDHLFFRNNNVAIFDPTRQAFRASPKYTMKELPDIVVVKDGRYIGVEAKVGKAVLSSHWEAFKIQSEETRSNISCCPLRPTTLLRLVCS